MGIKNSGLKLVDAYTSAVDSSAVAEVATLPDGSMFPVMKKVSDANGGFFEPVGVTKEALQTALTDGARIKTTHLSDGVSAIGGTVYPQFTMVIEYFDGTFQNAGRLDINEDGGTSMETLRTDVLTHGSTLTVNMLNQTPEVYEYVLNAPGGTLSLQNITGRTKDFFAIIRLIASGADRVFTIPPAYTNVNARPNLDGSTGVEVASGERVEIAITGAPDGTVSLEIIGASNLYVGDKALIRTGFAGRSAELFSDSQGQIYYYAPGSVLADDNELVIVHVATGSRYIRLVNGRAVIRPGLSDYSAIFTYSAANKIRLKLLEGTYPVLSPVLGTLQYGDIDWEGEGSGQTIIDMTSLSNSHIYGMRIVSDSTGANLTADALEGSRVVTAAPSGVQVGDTLRITAHPDRISAGNAVLWSPTRTYYFNGELNKVDSVSGGNITLGIPLRDSYIALNGALVNYEVRRVMTTRVNLKGLRFKRNANQITLEFNGCEIYFEDVYTEGGRHSGIALWYCVGDLVNCGSRDVWFSGSGNSYGLVLASCERIHVDGGFWFGGRHAIATGGNEPCDDIIIENLDAYSEPSGGQPGLDCHENTRNIIFRNCNSNGIAAQGKNLVLEDLEFRSNLAGDVAVVGMTKSGGTIAIRGMKILPGSGGGSGGLNLRFSDDNIAFGEVLISRFESWSARSGIQVFISLNGKTGCSLDRLEIDARIKISSNQQLVSMPLGFPVKLIELSGIYEGSGANDVVVLAGVETYTICEVTKCIVRHLSTNAFDGLEISRCMRALVRDSLIDVTAPSSSRAAVKFNDVESYHVESTSLRNATNAIFAFRTTSPSALISSMVGTSQNNRLVGNTNPSSLTNATLGTYIAQGGGLVP